ncbi:MAG: DUF4258 domain-containing protein [Candidatus Ratteibacteria bacterium]|nr:DUF4258 domain-containing protein [Candidatus Ratteibacteria bacterium]
MSIKNQSEEFKKEILTCLGKKLLFTRHALNQMLLQDRIISRDEIKEVIKSGEIIEDYPEDKRGHSCLIMGWTKEKRCIHVVCAPKEDYLAVITAYIPSGEEWEGFIRRKIK